jgi:hypothetical protein
LLLSDSNIALLQAFLRGRSGRKTAAQRKAVSQYDEAERLAKVFKAKYHASLKYLEVKRSALPPAVWRPRAAETEAVVAAFAEPIAAVAAAFAEPIAAVAAVAAETEKNYYESLLCESDTDEPVVTINAPTIVTTAEVQAEAAVVINVVVAEFICPNCGRNDFKLLRSLRSHMTASEKTGRCRVLP